MVDMCILSDIPVLHCTFVFILSKEKINVSFFVTNKNSKTI